MRGDNEERPGFVMCMNIVNSITHWVLGAVAILAITLAIIFPGSFHFTHHVYLCTIGFINPSQYFSFRLLYTYVVLMAQAVLTFNPNNGWSRCMRYQDKKVIHWVMQVTGSALAITGSIIRMVNLDSHFTSPHGILGIIAMILTAISLMGGVVGLYSKTFVFKLLHSFVGSLTLICAFITLCLGFDKVIFRGVFDDTTASLAIALTVFGLVGTLCSVANTCFNRVTKR